MIVRRLVALVAIVYLVCVYFDAAGSRLSPPVPRPFLYFAQIAALFPHAAEYAIDFRAELYFCDEKKYHEVDPGPFFPGHEDDKENRFQRAMFFYHDDKNVLRTLDEFLVARWNEAHPERRAGGALLFSLRLPLPKPGDSFPRYRRVPAVELPPDEHIPWYRTKDAIAEARCSR